VLETRLAVTRKEDPNYGYDGIHKLKLTLVSGGDDEKVVFDEMMPSLYPLAAAVPGYLLNPQGDRIAILLATTSMGFEGPPHYRHLTIVGARIGEKF
jgi:hypothetical protein